MACPICDKETEKKYRPFCSKRCADIDLGKWMNGTYAVASQDREDDEELEREITKALSDQPDRLH
jgi:endogenous inhibitor of DNA gyrase (YacG/DUF329 family)